MIISLGPISSSSFHFFGKREPFKSTRGGFPFYPIQLYLYSMTCISQLSVSWPLVKACLARGFCSGSSTTFGQSHAKWSFEKQPRSSFPSEELEPRYAKAWFLLSSKIIGIVSNNFLSNVFQIDFSSYRKLLHKRNHDLRNPSSRLKKEVIN